MDGMGECVSLRMDASIKGYGNAIVPQVAYEIFKTIEYLNNENL
jgi:hypothetical protein